MNVLASANVSQRDHQHFWRCTIMSECREGVPKLPGSSLPASTATQRFLCLYAVYSTHNNCSINFHKLFDYIYKTIFLSFAWTSRMGTFSNGQLLLSRAVEAKSEQCISPMFPHKHDRNKVLTQQLTHILVKKNSLLRVLYRMSSISSCENKAT